MIVHIQPDKVATLSIGITEQMQQDLIECHKHNKLGTEACDVCSWKKVVMRITLRDVEFPRLLNRVDVKLCSTKEVLEAVLAENNICHGCFGAANGDCDNCSRT